MALLIQMLYVVICSFETDLGYNVRWPSTSSYVVLSEIIAYVTYC